MSQVFKYLRKGYKQKIVPGIFEICKYPFWIFEKGYKQKIVLGFLRFCKYAF